MAEKGFQKQRAILRAVVNVSPINFFLILTLLDILVGGEIIAFKNIQKKNQGKENQVDLSTWSYFFLKCGSIEFHLPHSHL